MHLGQKISDILLKSIYLLTAYHPYVMFQNVIFFTSEEIINFLKNTSESTISYFCTRTRSGSLSLIFYPHSIRLVTAMVCPHWAILRRDIWMSHV
jgi:hypothetical protein